MSFLGAEIMGEAHTLNEISSRSACSSSIFSYFPTSGISWGIQHSGEYTETALHVSIEMDVSVVSTEYILVL